MLLQLLFQVQYLVPAGVCSTLLMPLQPQQAISLLIQAYTVMHRHT